MSEFDTPTTLSLRASKPKVFGKPPENTETTEKTPQKATLKISVKPVPSKTPSICVISADKSPVTFKRPTPSQEEFSAEEYEEEEEIIEPPKPILINKTAEDASYEYTYSEEELEPQPEESPEEEAEIAEATIEEEEQKEPIIEETPEEPKKEGLAGIISDLIPEKAPQEKIAQSIEMLELWQKQFIQTAEPMERTHMAIWYKSVSKLLDEQNMEDKNTGKYKTMVISKAREIISRHRFSFRNGSATHNIKLIVTGPRESGKSTYLGVLARQMCLDMMASGDWKQTFICPIDMAMLVHLLKDTANLYKAMVHLTFKALAAQKLITTRFIDGLILTFENVVAGNPLLPKAFTVCEDFKTVVPELKKLLNVLTECWNDSTAMAPFMGNIFKLPMLVGTIFGFKKLFMVVDHLDLSDVQITPRSTFADSDSYAFISELTKFMVHSGSFIISFKDTSAAAMNLLQNLTEESVDLNEGADFVSTLDVVEVDEKDRSKDFVITFEDNHPSITLGVNYFGGCAAYLEKWQEITALADEIDECGEEEDCEEQKLYLNATLQTILGQLLMTEDGSPLSLSVKSATRVDAKSGK